MSVVEEWLESGKHYSQQPPVVVSGLVKSGKMTLAVNVMPQILAYKLKKPVVIVHMCFEVYSDNYVPIAEIIEDALKSANINVDPVPGAIATHKWQTALEQWTDKFNGAVLVVFDEIHFAFAHAAAPDQVGAALKDF